VTSVEKATSGFVAQLALAGEPCNAFSDDYANLTLEVTYESKTRYVSLSRAQRRHDVCSHGYRLLSLHVNLYDTEDSQFRVPEDVVGRPGPPTESFIESSDLVFNYTSTPEPFAFWVTRRDDPEGVPLFDTRVSSLPESPIPPIRATDSSTALDGFNLVYEKQYLQVCTELVNWAVVAHRVFLP